MARQLLAQLSNAHYLWRQLREFFAQLLPVTCETCSSRWPTLSKPSLTEVTSNTYIPTGAVSYWYGVLSLELPTQFLRASSGLTSTAYFPTGAATAHLRIASSGRLATALATAVASRSRWTARDVAPLLRGETTTETPSLLARNAGRNWCQKWKTQTAPRQQFHLFLVDCLRKECCGKFHWNHYCDSKSCN